MGGSVSVQLEVQDRVGKQADLDEQLAEMHKRLEQQLLQQLDTQELLRCRHQPSFLICVSFQSVLHQQLQPRRVIESRALDLGYQRALSQGCSQVADVRVMQEA